ncbi:DUF5067 domain-containing protein [Schleiferilactobacillus perolens]|uniref:DUF5067 domain-containing protein n=1 Tax=Schleiferilactobacillus perolens TaxID=100468 RepID=UPI0009FB2572|nr:DUF5067 domain-containing protein [Schleiferilactobacillus perolens]
MRKSGRTNKQSNKSSLKWWVLGSGIIAIVVVIVLLIVVLSNPGTQSPDYTAATFENALNDGKKIDGKTVQFTVKRFEPRSAFGYNLITGKHLNFVSAENPDVTIGDTVTVTAKKSRSFVGSWIVSYENLKKDRLGKKEKTAVPNRSSSVKGTNKTSSTKSTSMATSKSENAASHDPNHWTFKNDVFDAGNMTYKLTKSEVRDSISDGKKNLVIYTDVTNNSKKEMDPSNIYMVVHATQKNDTSNKDLNPGMNDMDDEGNNALQEQEDIMNNNLLPGKTAQGVLIFQLENTNPVTLRFMDAKFQTIGTKIYNIK